MLFFNVIIIFFPSAAVEGAREGLIIWYNTALPALFPFAAAMCLLSSLNFTVISGNILSPIGRKLFNLSADGFFVFLSGITSGYPIGIAMLCELYGSGRIEREEAIRLSLFCNNSGPLFILGSVGAVMLKNSRIGVYILICHYLSAVIIGVIAGLVFPPAPSRKKALSYPTKPSFGSALSHSVETACRSMLNIGGFIVLFSVITKLLKITGIAHILTLPLTLLGQEPEMSEAIVLGLFEITKGCADIAALSSPFSPVIICMLVSFGGLSICAQSISFLAASRLPALPYIMGKTASAIIAPLILCALFFCEKSMILPHP